MPSVVAPSSPPSPTPAQVISVDTFTDPTGQHATEVEPSAAVFGKTIVAAFQEGRFLTLGSSDIGFAVSYDGGTSWQSGRLPGITKVSQPPGGADSVSDPVVAYDSAHGTWLIESLPVDLTTRAVLGVGVNRSADGVNWSAPVSLPPGPSYADKPWMGCDNAPGSPYYGRCYVEWDDGSTNGAIHLSFSTDGGVSWSVPRQVPGAGIGGQLLIRSDGRVIMPIDDPNETSVLVSSSSDGGVTWSAPVTVSPIHLHPVAGPMRAGPLNSATVDSSGREYIVWFDCRFRAACAQNDLVMSSSQDGVNWSAPARIAIDPSADSIDHFIASLAADPSAPGRLALTYYFYPQSACTVATCQLFAAEISSTDGGATWTPPRRLAGPIALPWIAQTTEGRMVGDYVATVYAGSTVRSIFAAALPPVGAAFNEAIYASK